MYTGMQCAIHTPVTQLQCKSGFRQMKINLNSISVCCLECMTDFIRTYFIVLLSLYYIFIWKMMGKKISQEIQNTSRCQHHQSKQECVI